MIRRFTIARIASAADLDIQAEQDLGCVPVSGVIVAEGVSVRLLPLCRGGRLKHTYSFLGLKLDTITSRDDWPRAKANVRYEFTADNPGEFATSGTSRLFINGKQQAEGKIEHTVPLRFTAYEGMDIGTDNGLPWFPTLVYAKILPDEFQRQHPEGLEFDVGPARLAPRICSAEI